MMEDPSKWVAQDNKYSLEKHQRERAENGFSVYDWWNFCDYLAWVNIQGLERFKDGVGHPADLPDMDAWRVELDIMIAGFKAHMTLGGTDYDWKNKEVVAELVTTKETGFALYAKRFSALWD